jgi:hypothetical protein
MTNSPTSQTCGSRRLLWIALLIACTLQSVELRFRGIDPDELEHLHASYMVFRGAVPYRDFFEHHGPAHYYALQPLFWLFGAKHAVLWFGRALLWFCSLGTLALTARIANRLAGPPTGMVAATLLAWTTIFQLKGIELRPDVPATLLMTACAALALDAPASWRRWMTIGALAGLATLFTQKSIVPIAGFTIAASLRAWFTGQARRTFIIPVAMAAGGALAWGGTLTASAAVGAQGDFLHGTIEQLLTWPVRSRRWDQLRPTLVAEMTVWIAGLVEIIFVLRQFRRVEAWHDGRLFVAIATLFSIGSLVWVKATYSQFYLLWFPFLAAMAACRLVAWGRADVRKPTIMLVCAAGGLLILAQAALGSRALELGTKGAVPNLSELLRQGTTQPALAPSAILLAAGAALWWCGLRRWPAVVGIVASLGMFHAVLRDFDAALWSNKEQVRRMDVLEHRVGPDETVLDGYSGYGALRQHTYYFWWINDYSLALMSPAERDAKLLAALQAAPPAAVLFDRDLARLPDSVTDWIESHYQPSADESWLWLPKREKVAVEQ